MTDPRKPIFDALRSALGGKLGADDVTIMDDTLDRLGVPKEKAAMKTSQKGIDLIHSFESLKLTSYKDPGSKNGLPITNGWGTTRDENGGPIPLGAVWDKAKADRLFARDLEKFEAEVSKAIGGTPTTQNQFDALVSFHYNTGAIASSTLGKLHKAGDYAGAAAQFGRWINNDGKPLEGLKRRRAAERELYVS
ncbi:lysozyme [Novosphingobium sp. ZW T3_23]|uniref:lysozyme n=1 Tax=Novosphingobium sp. ZW T3_23 TaxID=3378084 RepID=UPI003851EA7C